MGERIGIAGASKDEQAQSATDHNSRPDADYRSLENVRKLLERGGEVNVGEVLKALAWALEEIKTLESKGESE